MRDAIVPAPLIATPPVTNLQRANTQASTSTLTSRRHHPPVMSGPGSILSQRSMSVGPGPLDGWGAGGDRGLTPHAAGAEARGACEIR